MDLGISGRRAAVAAGSAGLGLATASALAAEGVHLAICGRDEQRLDAAASAIRASSPDAFVETIVADMSRTDEAVRFVQESETVLGGPIDILVANSGGPPPGTFETTDLSAYRSAFESNCLSTVALCQAAVPAMRERRWGRVIAITSIGARQPIGQLTASTTARAAVTAFLKVLSTEVAPDGVTVNNLQPGLHATDRVKNLSGENARGLTGDIPAGVIGDATDFGQVAAFLCSTHAQFITGVGLHVDGGAYRGLQ